MKLFTTGLALLVIDLVCWATVFGLISKEQYVLATGFTAGVLSFMFYKFKKQQDARKGILQTYYFEEGA